MAISVRTSNAWKSVTVVSVMVGGAWKNVTGIGVKVNGAWKTAFGVITPSSGDLDTTQDRTTVEGSRTGAGSITTQSVTVAAVPASGTGPYTYLWTKVSGADFTINAPTNGTTTFSRTMANGESVSAVYKCTTTDFVGATKENTVTVNGISAAAAPLVVTLAGYRSSGPTFLGPPYGIAAYFRLYVASVTGGNGSYTYNWSEDGNNSLQSFSDTEKQYIYYSSLEAGTVTITCEVTDTAGATGTDTIQITSVNSQPSG